MIDPQQQQSKVLQVGLILELIVQRGDMLNQKSNMNHPRTPFHCDEVPTINIVLYYIVVSFHAGLHDSQASSVLILLERFCQIVAKKSTYEEQ